MKKIYRYGLTIVGALASVSLFAQGPTPPPPPDPPCWPPPCIPINNGMIFLMIAGALLAGIVLYRSFKTAKQ